MFVPEGCGVCVVFEAVGAWRVSGGPGSGRGENTAAISRARVREAYEQAVHLMLFDRASGNAINGYEDADEAWAALRRVVEANPDCAETVVVICFDAAGMPVGDSITFADLPASPSAAKERADQAIARRERVIREYQLRARAAVLVLINHGLEAEYLDAYRELAADRLPDSAQEVSDAQ